MNFLGLKKLSKEKRNELIIVVLITILVLGGLGYGLIRGQYGTLNDLADQKLKDDAKLQLMLKTAKLGSQAQGQLETDSKALAALEENMGSRDLYSWFISTIRPFKQSYRVEIPQIGQPVEADMTLLPQFPYRQASFSLAGSGRFYDLGRFISDLENQFPHLRVVNLDLEPSASGTDKETLAFRMDVVVLVKPNAS